MDRLDNIVDEALSSKNKTDKDNEIIRLSNFQVDNNGILSPMFAYHFNLPESHASTHESDTSS
jgi:hypothetical protein